MHVSLKQPRRFALSLTALAALGLAALAPTAARAQTQDLFVTNSSNNTISRFAGTGPGTFSTTATTLSSGGLSLPQGLAFDGRGDLFAANYTGGTTGAGSITEFASTGAGVLGMGTTFASDGTLNGPGGLAFDAKGDLFAADNNGNSITEFASTGPGTFAAGRNFATGGTLNGPAFLAFDAKGDLFTSNANTNTITEFAFNSTAGSFGTGTTIETGLNQPIGLAFDAKGDLFAANYGDGIDATGSITEFIPTGTGTFGAGRNFAAGLNGPSGLAFDARGDLFAADTNANSVLEFAFNPTAGTFGAAKTVEAGLNGPFGLAFGPSVSAPVPEASTTVSLGLLLTRGWAGW